MNSEYFNKALQQLCIAIELPTPNPIEPVMSLKIGPYVCSISEHPADHLLMFMELDPKAEAAIDTQNMYCQDLCKPVLGRDPLTGMQLLWSRQSLLQLDRSQAHHQLEQLVEAAQSLSGLADI
ncbi:CesT family type III secretion system chaperone [Pseudomonas alkylphenolica]|uniref:CesT family type III secretion system chaperone n=1 Tax=Pseudomonas alkylphenolica TaxID=237609 RepID=UPI000FB91623